MGNENSTVLTPEEREELERRGIVNPTPAQVEELRRRGFGKKGPMKDTEASDWQKELKNVSSDHKFSNLQSNGMRVDDPVKEAPSDSDGGLFSLTNLGIAGALAVGGYALYQTAQAQAEARASRERYERRRDYGIGAGATLAAIGYHAYQAMQKAEEEKKELQKNN